jgi:hypothetical protein
MDVAGSALFLFSGGVIYRTPAPAANSFAAFRSCRYLEDVVNILEGLFKKESFA